MTMRPRILLVDDDPDLLRLLSIRLNTAGWEVMTADSAESALSLLEERQPQVVVTDLRMDGMDGMAFFDIVHERFSTLPVIILTAHGTIPEAVEATKRGVFTFLTKPFDSKDLLDHINRALRISGVVASENGGERGAWSSEIISRSAVMDELLKQARRVADSSAAVLIHGESGTGKELLARAIHKAGPRRDRPFLGLNCSAIPESLLESELFGHNKGAFTSATRDHKGLFQAAEGGTLFLDEIGDMPLPLQAKLLRVLEEKEVRPVGATANVRVDVRIISASHHDLDELVKARQFREDLYYRLNVVRLDIPPLRERPEDVQLLANHFLREIAANGDTQAQSFAPEAMERLVTAPWPGNVRQLLNVVEYSATLCTTAVIPLSLVQRALRLKTGALPSLSAARRNFEREYLMRLLKMTEGNITQAARLAQRNRTELYKLLHRYHLNPETFRGAKSAKG
ncbi:MAG: sigma 54-interacting transcriptional regulator [Gammaproteobacteria bacterium]|jgi:two-component system response regulator GlrR|nr:sigma 54-interacting transcriptional regulator [Gammaproteobacteria bacterium]